MSNWHLLPLSWFDSAILDLPLKQSDVSEMDHPSIARVEGAGKAPFVVIDAAG